MSDFEKSDVNVVDCSHVSTSKVVRVRGERTSGGEEKGIDLQAHIDRVHPLPRFRPEFIQLEV